MKLASAALRRFFEKPDPGLAGVLVYGAEPSRVEHRRRQLQDALLGTDGEAEMRLTRIAAADLRRDHALLLDAVRAPGFFAGPRVVALEDAGDGAASDVEAALAARQPGDGVLLVTARSLPARSKLRVVFEKSPVAVAAPVYDDPPAPEEVARLLFRAGLHGIDADAKSEAVALAQRLEPGDFAQMVEKLALYKLGDDEPVTSADVAACAPSVTDAALDETVNLVAEGRVADVGARMRRHTAQGSAPVSACIAAQRHFRRLHAAACDTSGADTALSRLRPPVYGARRERLRRQLGKWNAEALEKALQVLSDTDLALRSPRPVPAEALLERAFLRIAMMTSRR
ncbi:MAG: DNA polymerase III subunit delta [Paracoccaceae bacterium]